MTDQVQNTEEYKGAKALIYLMNLGGTKWTHEQAVQEWNKMSEFDQHFTMKAFEQYQPQEKMKIAMKDGSFLNVPEDFEIDDKNLIKVNLIDESNQSEGIWAYVTAKGKHLHDTNRYTGKDEYDIALTANTALMGIPYAAYIPIRYNGKTRPHCKLEWLDLDAKACIEFSLLKPSKE